MLGKKYFIVLVMFLVAVPLVMSSAAAEENYRIKRLVSQLYEKKTAMNAQRRLEGYGTEVSEYLVAPLRDTNNENVQIAALRIIASVNDPSMEKEVVRLLDDKDYRVRQEAAKTLSVIADSPSSIEPLKQLLSDYYPDVRYNAINALARLARPEETDLFISALGDYDPRVRVSAVKALGKLKSEKAVPYLVQMVRDYDPEVRMQLVKTLGEIGSGQAVQGLAVLVKDPDPNVRLFAVETVSGLKGKEVGDILVDVAGGTDPRLAAEAIRLLAERQDPRTLEIAKEHVDDEHLDVKLASIEAIGELGGKAEVPLLESMLDAESTSVRQEAGRALGKVNERI